MTEQEWQTATDPTPMLEFLRGKASDRKLRLFAVACCRRVWTLLEDKRHRFIVERAEQYADGVLSLARMNKAVERAQQAGNERRYQGSELVGDWHVVLAAEGLTIDFDAARIADNVATARGEIASHFYFEEVAKRSQTEYETAWREQRDSASRNAADAEEKRSQTVLLRDIFGNPIRPVTVEPSWLTSTVTALANGIYTEKAFDRLPILADALMDAGCSHDDLLNHLRSDGPHVRGCWALDLVLGKT
ncbi:hypothetical protein [Gemmata palustris]|uniref:hypothetical protein n=1 Tax=Gemmata palustris TaxID=2822762 RepID=UPI001FE97E9C|nr:hypothetical protein [Gemmata palustris]